MKRAPLYCHGAAAIVAARWEHPRPRGNKESSMLRSPTRAALLALSLASAVTLGAPPLLAQQAPAQQPAQQTPARPARAPQAPPAQGLDRISHILVIYMENRSFDNVFGEYPGAEGIARARDPR